MKEMGNLKSNAIYNPDEVRNPPPTNMVEQERDSDLEKYIRGIYKTPQAPPLSNILTGTLQPSTSTENSLTSEEWLRQGSGRQGLGIHSRVGYHRGLRLRPCNLLHLLPSNP